MSAKHRPGPWAVSDPPRALMVLDHSGTEVADCTDMDAYDSVTAEANARLIAAAPDGHALLEGLAEWFANGRGPSPSSLFDDDRTWAIALAHYIAKVRGESP